MSAKHAVRDQLVEVYRRSRHLEKSEKLPVAPGGHLLASQTVRVSWPRYRHDKLDARRRSKLMIDVATVGVEQMGKVQATGHVGLP
jgi:hypothetical protein